MKPYLTNCKACGKTTSRKYAHEHTGHCKTCVTGSVPAARIARTRPTREERILEHGYEAYCREEGQDGNGDCPF